MKNSSKQEFAKTNKFPQSNGTHPRLAVATILQKLAKEQTYLLEYEKSFMPLTGSSILKKTLNASWCQRYFLLTSTRLLYFTDSSMRNLKGCFNLVSLIEHRLKIKQNFPLIKQLFSKYRLIVWVNHEQQTQKTLLQLKIDDQELYKQWAQQLQRVLFQIKLMNLQYRMLFPQIKNEQLLESNSKLGLSNGNFWNSLQISQNQLLKYASHLDIILLRSKNPLFYVHRFFMRSYYDHIAILIKDQDNKIYLLEAIQSTGVSITSLQSLRTFFQEQYEQIGYRKLLKKDDANFKVQQLEEYINSILGSSYELSLKKLLIDNQSIQIEDENFSQNYSSCESQIHKKTYFCSELVADIYLKFGILANGKSNNYWPKDFQQDSIIFSQEYAFSPIMKVQLQDFTYASELSEV